MAIRRSHKWLKAKKNRRQRKIRAQRHADRDLRIEPLEDRVLLTTGPQLAGIQPNVGELLMDNEVRNTAPRDLSFLFSSVASIDPTSIPTDEANLSAYDSIQILRSGADGTFENSSVFSDFNTGGAVQIEFTAVAPGTAGSLASLVVTKGDLGDGADPTVSVTGQQIAATLNTAVGSETTARDLVDAINADADASKLVTARIRSGAAATDIATPDITYSPLTMDAANSASAVTDFNARNGLAVKFTAASTGQDGNGVMVSVSKSDLGDGTAPDISVNGKTIAVVLNTNTNTPTTAQQLVDAINADTASSALVVASVRSGAGDTDISAPVINYSPIVLGGANDVRIQPGYVDFGASDQEIIVRFQETLPDDIYRIEILGSGPTPLRSVDGEAFNGGENFTLQFQLDLGAQIVSVVPQPVERTETGALIQRRDQIVVYFNDDDLDPAAATDARFYQLVHTAETVINQDDVILTPTLVEYDAAADRAVLTFAQNLDSLIDPVTGVLLDPGTLRLRIGTDEARPLPPLEMNAFTDPGSSFDTAMDLANQWDTGPSIRVLLNGDAFIEGQLLTLTDTAGAAQQFEFDSGYTMQVPAAGAVAGGIEDGQTFTLDDGTPVVFEFDSDGSVAAGNIAVPFVDGDLADTLADAIVTAVGGAGLGLSPVKLPGAAVHIGGPVGLTLDTTSSALSQSGTPGAQTPGAIAIPFIPATSFTPSDMAAAITTSVNSASFTVVATQDGDLVRLDGDLGTRLSTTLTGLKLVSEGLLVNSTIQSPMFPVDFPGGDDEPGHRDIPRIEDHLMAGADSTAGPTTYFYNFQDVYGVDPVTFKPLHNAITENEKQRTREIFDFYGRYLGAQFIESDTLGFTIVTGDLRAVDPTVPTGPGGVAGIAGGGLAVMDLADFSNPDDDRFGGPWFQTAMHEIGHLMGLGHTYDLPPLTIMGDEGQLSFGQAAEGVFPGDDDIAHGEFLYRPDSNDIDLYQFQLKDTGLFSVETIAERQSNPSLLDSVLTLYKAVVDNAGNEIGRELMARNDDYYSHDSYLEMELLPGKYFVGVSASGNNDYDPTIEDSGTGGRTAGQYQLRFNFRPSADNMLVDTSGIPLDGDADGNAGGVYNFWFRTAAPAGTGAATAPHTYFVDKSAAAGGDGSLAAPFNRIPDSLAAAQPDDIVRLVGNAGADGDITTVDDNLAYQIGFSRVGGAVLEDGSTLEVPQGVTVMIDANAVLKLRRARIGVGSSAHGLDRSAGALQVLGTPRLLDSDGNVILDATGRPVAGSVYFTSLHDTAVGQDNNPDQSPPAARPGDWGGIIFRDDLDRADSDRRVYADDGIFLNYVNNAEMTYGGGAVFINGISQVVTPIEMIDDRPTLSFNSIRLSADAAISANPDSFEEDNFHAPKFQRISFTSDYNRVGPDIYGNTIVDNSLNGLFIRIATPAGQDLEALTKSARWDDTDIVHIVAENLVIQGQPGGPLLEQTAPPVNLVKLTALTGGTLDTNQYDYKLVFVDADGNEGPSSNATAAVDIPADGGQVLLENLPTLHDYPQFVARRIYRSIVGSGRYELVAEINAEDVSYLDSGSSLGALLQNIAFPLRARFDARLSVDPGTIIKLDRARIDTSFGAQLIAEGRDGQPVVFTSISDARYGFGGTFDTNLQKDIIDPAAGDWAGLYLGHMSRNSIDYSVVAYGGGTTKIEGSFAGFNPIEIHQSETRVARSRFEFNADGSGGLAPADRYGRGSNDSATIFVRGAQPTILANTFADNDGAVISINANALNADPHVDLGRATGQVDVISGFQDNEGPLVRLNRLNTTRDNGSTINGMVVRGATLTTAGVWDDTDIVHVVNDTIYVPDFHTSGGVRLESNPRESLVVKLQGPTAGFTATGRELDITDRIGGSLQIIGQPRFPVVLTALSDDSVGAGYTSEGVPQNDTNGDGSGRGRLPTGPEVDNGTLIDDDVQVGIPGQFSFDAMAGGNSDFFGRGGISAQGNTRAFIDENVIFDFTNYVDVGSNGGAISLANTTITTPPTLIAHDLVVSEGNFQGANGLISWRAESRMDDGISIVYNTLFLTSTSPLGNVQVINYLDEDIDLPWDDLLYLTGTPGEDDFRAFTLDDTERVGFSHGGFYNAGDNLVNATYDGWAADQYPQLQFAITGSGTTYSIPGNIDTADIQPFTDPELGDVYGLADVTTAFAWSADATASSAQITTLLELIPRNPATLGKPGDWQGIQIDEFANDRNVDVTTEREPRDSINGPDNNQDPSNAQFLGGLATSQQSGDDNLRLGFEVHGVVSEPGDIDVYSFQAEAGTEVWFDIDQTSNDFDSVIELVDADGNILVQSDNTLAEELGTLPIYVNAGRVNPLDVHSLRMSATDFYPSSALGQPKDLWSTNPSDAGMRVILPGSLGTTNLYHVRVRSSNLLPGDDRANLQDPTMVGDGLTAGIYRLQIRLGETDEVPGTTVQYADIRYATNGIEVHGQPTHSPLQGEAAEDFTANDALNNAQPIGNVLNSDRGAIAVAGDLATFDDVDFYQFDVTYDSTQNITGFTNAVQHLSTIFDIDYADGLGRPNTRLSVFDAQGNLVMSGTDSNIADDQPAALKGVNTDDLSRGSAGTMDAYIGTQELPVGTYYVAVSSEAQIPREYEQFFEPVPANSLFRLEPADGVERIVEDHINSSYYTTATAPQIPVLFDNDSVVPYQLNDVALYVSTEIGGLSNARLYTVNPFTGTLETTVGWNSPGNITNINRDIEDIAMREDGTIHAFSLDVETGPTDNGSGNYLEISHNDSSTTNIGDDGITTWQANNSTPPGDQAQNIGYQFQALTYGAKNIYQDNRLFAVGYKTRLGPGNSYAENVLFQFNADTGAATSRPTRDRGGCGNPGGCRYVGAGSNIVERGYLDTQTDLLNQTDRWLVTVEATDVDPSTGATQFLINDGVSAAVDEDANPATAPVVFELNSGPDIRIHPDAANGIFLRDGDTFSLDGIDYEFDTGSVVVVQAVNGGQITDGELLTLTDSANLAQSFEFDKDGTVGAGNIAISVTNGMSTAQLVAQMAAGINGAPALGIVAQTIAGSNRITLLNESSTTAAVSTAANVVVEGAPGGTAGTVITVEENFDTQQLGQAIVAAFNGPGGVPGITAGLDGQRVNFSGAILSDFDDVEARGVVTDMHGDGSVGIGAVSVPFFAQDTGDDIANRIAAALNNSGIAATSTQRSVQLVAPAPLSTFVAADAPLIIAGAPSGGQITGIAMQGTTMYAITDTGGLFRVDNPSTPFFATAVYLPTSAQDLAGIQFESLSFGPAVTENGDLSSILFGMDSRGELYAFDTAGHLQPVFVDGQTSVSTGLGGAHGIAFSTLEENPWQIASGSHFRPTDPGHKIETTFDLSRPAPAFPANGNSSFVFGRGDDKDYNLPSGAFGSLESHPFSLVGYSPEDKPVLYFDYFAQTEEESSDPATQTPMRDAFRVFVGDESGQWTLLATNNSYAPDELSFGPNIVQESYDNNTGWRQVRVPLDNYAGLDNVKIRIDFSTAGTMNVGDLATKGVDLRVLPAARLSDGQTFSIDGRVFEIDLGYTLVAPSGAAIADGDQFKIADDAGQSVTFEFDSTGATSAGTVAVSIHSAMTPEEVAQAMEAAVRGALTTTNPAGVAQLNENRLNLPTAIMATISAANDLEVIGNVGTAGIPVHLHAGMTTAEVVTVVQQAIADTFAGGTTDAVKIPHDEIVRVVGHQVTDPGPFGLTDQLPGDSLGDYYSSYRGRNNAFEGIYVDNFIIGPTERGEMATNAAGLTTFYDNPQLPLNQVLNGAYQLEVRRGEQYGDSLDGPPTLALFRSFDTNDRLSQTHTLVAPPAEQISDGQTFTLSDGNKQLVFEFDDVTLSNGVLPGNVRIPFDPAAIDPASGDARPQTAAEVAASIRDAINSAAAQAVLDITADLADGVNAAWANSTSNVINLNGNVDAQLISPALQATPSMDANQLRDAILGGAFTPVGDALYTGGSQSSGFFSGGGDSIGISSGIVLTNGDVSFVEGPNNGDGSTGFASQEGDADLDAIFAPLVTEDTSALEFSFHVDQTTNLAFEFVFSSEEYNEFVDSVFNDVFAFILDGQNIALLPGTTTPVSINTINGGNPFGSGGTNPQFYNNNDLNDGAPFADQFGHDGFTDVLVARMDNLAAGDHTIKLAIADVADQALDSAVFIRAFNDFAPDPRTQIGGIVYNDRGDQSRDRDQGQIVIQSNRISNSLQFGMTIDAGTRSTEGKPHSGPVRVTRSINNLDLVPGVVATNNLIYRNGAGGIDFSGDPNSGSDTTAPVPFGRIINNTIVGGSVAIAVHDNASPTLLNNIVADTNIGLDIDGSSSSTVVGGTVYAGVATPATNGTIGLGEFPLTVATSRQLFINKDLDNYYLAPDAVAIDSSIDSLQDRSAMVSVRDPLGIDPSPILAPETDLYGQQRVDDPDVSTPSGLGHDVFKDRGAIDRSDFAGPSAVLITPRDNDAAGTDIDSRDTYVKLIDQTLFDFSIQLLDGVQPSNQSNGTGADPNTVLPATVALTRDGILLEEGVDYRFSYDATSATIRLTPLAGIWEPDHAYEIQLLNQDVVLVTANSGELVSDGETFTVTDTNGLVVPFEFESGYTMQVPTNGGADIVDGSVLTITIDTTTYRFEFDDNGTSQPNSIAIPFTSSDTPEQVADAIVAAVIGASIGLTPVHPGDGFIQLGGDATTVLDTSQTALTQAGLPGVTAGAVAIPFMPHTSFDATTMAGAIADAINTSSLAGVTAAAQLNTVVVAGAQSVQGIGVLRVQGISDLAGNILQPNRFGGTTGFSILLGTGFDYGDAPDPTYPVLKASNGAQHKILEGFMLGTTIFASVDGQPSAGADADPGDDGVTFTDMTIGYDTSINVVATGITGSIFGHLDAWIDFNADGDWDDAGEQIANGVDLVDGTNNLVVTVPADAIATDTYARFRLSTEGGLGPEGSAGDGEVEDYQVQINPNPWQNSANSLDVNVDGRVTPLDALLIINRINFHGTGPLPNPPTPDFTPPPYYDVNGDGHLAPIDALLVINYLNTSGGSGEGEGESGAPYGGLAADAATDPSNSLGFTLDAFASGTVSSFSAEGNIDTVADVSDATQPSTLTTLYTGAPETQNSGAEVRPQLLAGQFRTEQMDDLLDAIADEVGQQHEDAEAVDAVFARYDA